MRISDWSSDVCSSDLSEVTGLALSPDGNRLYFNSERGMGIAGLPIGPGPGILYEVTGPFRGGTLAGAPPAAAAPTTTATAVPGATVTTGSPGRAAGPSAGSATLPATGGPGGLGAAARSEEHTSELQSLMRTSYAVF